LPLNRIIVYSYNTEFDGNYYGNSDLRSAYTPWWNKKFIRKLRNIRNERFGMPFVVGYHPPGAGQDEVTALYNALKNLQAKSVATMPKYGDGEDWIKFIESKMSQGKGDVFDAAINYEDRCIARSALMPDMLGFSETKFGSRALGETQYSLYELMLEFLRQELEEDVIFEQIIKQLIDLNFQNVTYYPKYKFYPLSEEDKFKIISSITQAVEKGIVLPTISDEEYTRKLLGYPVPEKKEERRQLPKKDTGTKKDINLPEDEKAHIQFKEFSRKLNKYEKRVNLKEINDSMDELEDNTLNKLVSLTKDMRKKIIKDAVKIIDNGDIAAVGNIEIPYKAKMESIFKDFMLDSFKMGQGKAKSIVHKLKSEKGIEIKMAVEGSFDLPPTKSLQWLKQQAILLAGSVRGQISKNVKTVLMNGLKDGKARKDVVFEIEKVLAPYVDEFYKPQAAKNPYLYNTILRTNNTTAYNMGLKQEWEKEDFVEAWEYSAVLDDRTTSYCEAMDGEIFKKNEPDFKFPPAHFNCRSIALPVVEGDDYELSELDPLNPKGNERAEGFK